MDGVHGMAVGFPPLLGTFAVAQTSNLLWLLW
jgi:hypothetical protein